jgi:hypothetical protein
MQSLRTMGEETDLFLMANLSPRMTGLPFVAWISPRGGARHDVQVKVSSDPRANPDEMVTVAIRPVIRLVEGDMPGSEFSLLCRWITLNQDILSRYWDGDITYAEEALAALRRIARCVCGEGSGPSNCTALAG